MGLSGFVQNRPDGRVLLIAEGSRENLEKLASAINIKDAIIDVHKIDFEFSGASGAYSSFRKSTGPDEIGERLDDGIAILKELVAEIRMITANTEKPISIRNNGFAGLNEKMDQTLDKEDQTLDKQDSTIGETQELRSDMKNHLD